MRRAAALLFLFACSQGVAVVPPASTPPPPPTRPGNVATARGNVFDSAGQPVPHVLIQAWSADPSCKPSGEPVRIWSGASSTFNVTVDRGAGGRGCIVLEAMAGGAKARRTFPVSAAVDVVEADINLPPPKRLTRAEADRIIEVVRLGINTRDRAAVDELTGYLGAGPDAVSTTLADIQRHLRTVTAVRFVSGSGETFVYELAGQREPAQTVTIRQDSLTRIEF
jgi:hypothetical protein